MHFMFFAQIMSDHNLIKVAISIQYLLSCFKLITFHSFYNIMLHMAGTKPDLFKDLMLGFV